MNVGNGPTIGVPPGARHLVRDNGQSDAEELNLQLSVEVYLVVRLKDERGFG